MPTRKPVAALLAETLKERGIDTVFTIPGTQNIGVLHHFEKAKLHLVTATSELSAAYMANGFARATGQPGVLLTIAGPGIATALSGIAEAHHDSTPLLVLIVDTERSNRSFDLQELELSVLLRPLTKEFYAALDPEDACSTVVDALHETNVEEPGPVAVVISSRIALELSEPREINDSFSSESPDVASIAAEIRTAKNPLLFVGAGAASISQSVVQFAEQARLPVITTCSGRGIVPDSHPLLLKYDFSHGVPTPLRERIIQSDRIIIFGAKLSHNGTGGFSMPFRQRQLIQVDSSADVLEAAAKFTRVNLCARMEDIIEPLRGALSDYRSAWSEQELESLAAESLSHKEQQTERDPQLAGMSASAFFSTLCSTAPSDAIYVTDSGFHQVLARKYLTIEEPRTLITPTDFQSMGFGMPAAIGAAYAKPASSVVAIVGDGGFLMNGLDLARAKQLGVAITVFCLTDRQYNLIRMQQAASFGSAPASLLPEIDYRTFAASIGIRFHALESVSDVALADIFTGNEVTLVQVPVSSIPGLLSKQFTAKAKEHIRSVIGQDTITYFKRVIGKG